MPIELVPVIGPSIIPLPSKSGVAVGAKPVSGEFGIRTQETTSSVNSVFIRDDSEESEWVAWTIPANEDTEITAISNYLSDGEAEALTIDSLVSIDLGLLAFAADGALSVEE